MKQNIFQALVRRYDILDCGWEISNADEQSSRLGNHFPDSFSDPEGNKSLYNSGTDFILGITCNKIQVIRVCAVCFAVVLSDDYSTS